MRPTRKDIEHAKATVRTNPDLDLDDEVELDRLSEGDAKGVEDAIEGWYAQAVPHFRKLEKGDYSQIRALQFVVQDDPGLPPATVVYYYAVEGDPQAITPHPEAPNTPLFVYPDGRAVTRVVAVPLRYHHLFEELCELRFAAGQGRPC